MKDLEIWKPIPGFPGYEASTYGRIKSTERIVEVHHKVGYYTYTIPERIMKPHLMNSGYLGITLCLKGKHINTIVHRLIASTFIDNPYYFPEVNHKNEIKTDNRVDNLEWCTRSYNKNFGTGNKRSGINRGKKVLQFDLNGKFIREWDTIRMASAETNTDQKSIINCCKNKIKKANNFIWRYKYERS